MKKKRAFEYTDTEKQELLQEYFDSGMSLKAFAKQANISENIISLWIEQSNATSVYLTLFHSTKDATIQCVYTEQNYFDERGIPNEDINPHITSIISQFFNNHTLKQQYYEQVTQESSLQYEINKEIVSLLTDAGLNVLLEQNMLNSEFMCKATMYLIDPSPKNFLPQKTTAMLPDKKAPVVQTYLRIKPGHDWARPDGQKTFIKILCVDKKAFDENKEIKADESLSERLSIILDGFTLKEEYTPRHYKDYETSNKFWGHGMMDYYDVKINADMTAYIINLLKSLNITAITDNQELNQKFMIASSDDKSE